MRAYSKHPLYGWYLIYQKGIDILICVVKKIKEPRKVIRFVLMGHGDPKNEVKDWIADAGVEYILHNDGVSDESY